jgi:hypothetical protein
MKSSPQSEMLTFGMGVQKLSERKKQTNSNQKMLLTQKKKKEI